MNPVKKLHAIAFFGLMLLAANGASAQTIHGTLRDVSDLQFMVEPLDLDAQTCGISELKLDDAVKAGAKGAGFALDGYDYELYLRISSLPQGSDCYSSIDIEVRYIGKLLLPAYPKGNIVRAVLWSGGTIIVSPRNQHGNEVSAVVTGLVRGLVADWIKDNSLQKAG